MGSSIPVLPILSERTVHYHFHLIINFMHQLKTVQVGDLTLTYLKNAEQHAKAYNKDIISGTYEGGFTLWQCTVDLMNYIKDIHFAGKRVLEIGCGHGLVGILALLKGAASVCFADFNKDVLEKLTMKNIENNTNKQTLSKCSFLYGDWMDMQPIGPPIDEKFDLILGSELIYQSSNYQKIVYVIDKYLKEDGEAILANKLYYFGVGGSVPEFTEYVESKGLKSKSLQKLIPESGNRKEIISVSK